MIKVSFASLYDYQIEWMHPGKRESDGKIEEVNDVVEIPSRVRENVKKRNLVDSYVSEFLYGFSGKIREKEEGKASLLEDLCKKRGLVEVDTSRNPKDPSSYLQQTMRIWFRLVLKKTNGDTVTKEEAIRNWLAARDRLMRVSPNNLIQISIKQDGVREDKLDGLCFVRIDDTGNVKSVYFNGDGMDRFFNAGDLSGKEFAQALVKNYSGIPKLTPDGTRDNLEKYGSIETITWTYKDPKGYQVKLFERAYINGRGQRYTSDKTLFKNDAETSYYLSMAQKQPKKFFTVFAIKPESARKFD